MGKQKKVETPKVVRSTNDHQTIHPNLVVVKEKVFTPEQEAYIANMSEMKEYLYGAFATK